jgi:D-amino peptidase
MSGLGYFLMKTCFRRRYSGENYFHLDVPVCASLAPSCACALIEEAARAAIPNVRRLQPFTIAGPLECELTTQTPGQADLFCQWPDMRRVDGSTLRFGADSMQSLVRVLHCLSAMSFMLR